jgi:hypothetical protein
MLSLIACGAGIYLGLHFNVLVLLRYRGSGLGTTRYRR